MQRVSNKIALVTGGSRGIGAAIVKRLAREGAIVHFTYLQAKEKAEQLEKILSDEGLRVKAIKADNGQAGEITKVVEGIISEHGRLDILVNSAGIYIGKAIEEHSIKDYDDTFAVNVRAVTEACLAAAKCMNENGRIITIGSTMGERVPFAGGTFYSMSKSALLGLTRGLARDLGTKNITVNLVQPGPVDTDMNPENSTGADFQRSMMAIPKYGKPEHIAGMVAYIASEEAGYATGTVFTMDGGTNC